MLGRCRRGRGGEERGVWAIRAGKHPSKEGRVQKAWGHGTAGVWSGQDGAPGRTAGEVHGRELGEAASCVGDRGA